MGCNNQSELQTLKLGVIGFEYQHIPDALYGALKTISKNDSVNYIPTVWTGRNGIFDLIGKLFPDCKCLDYNDFRELKFFADKINDSKLLHLTKTEIEHFSYTYSRQFFLRKPENITSKDIQYFKTLASFATNTINQNKLDLLIFSDIPHSMIDLAFFVAARRKKCRVIVRDGPYFGDFVGPVLLPSESKGQFKSWKKGLSAQKIGDEVRAELLARTPSEHFQPVSYASRLRVKLPDLPSPSPLFFNSLAVQKVYGYSNSKYVALIAEKLLHRIFIVLAAIKVWFYKLIAVALSSKIPEKDDDFFYVLLHYHPERTTSAAALDTPFEVQRIEALAHKFPDCKIVIKEHPLNLSGNFHFVNYRNLWSHFKLCRLSNVVFLMSGNSQLHYKMMKNATAVLSTSGTHALESIQIGTPSIHFSNSFASGFPGVLILESVSEIKLNDLKVMKKSLRKMKFDDILKNCLDAVRKAPKVEGFIAGIHYKMYTPLEFIKSAENILFWLLKYEKENFSNMQNKKIGK